MSQNDRDEDWKNANSIFKRGFRFPRRPRILRCLTLEGSLCNEQNKNSVRALHFLVHFLVVTARLPRKNLLMRRFAEDVITQREIFLPIFEFGCGPWEFAYIFHSLSVLEKT